MSQLEELIEQLEELCCCDPEDSDEICIHCDAKQQIQAQQRTIRLLTERLNRKSQDTSCPDAEKR